MSRPLQAAQMRIFRAALASIESGAAPTVDDWRTCSDVVNLLETLKAMGCEALAGRAGAAEGVIDADGLVDDAIEALAMAGERHMAGQPIRFTPAGLRAMHDALDGYGEALAGLSHDTMHQAHQRTVDRIQRLLQTAPTGVTVLSL